MLLGGNDEKELTLHAVTLQRWSILRQTHVHVSTHVQGTPQENKYAFNAFFNIGRESAFCTACGNLFHTVGAVLASLGDASAGIRGS